MYHACGGVYKVERTTDDLSYMLSTETKDYSIFRYKSTKWGQWKAWLEQLTYEENGEWRLRAQREAETKID